MTTSFKPPIVPATFPAMVAHVLVGYGLLMALLLLRLLPWIMELRRHCARPRADAGAIALLAPYLLAGANIVVGLIFLGTLRLIIQGRLLRRAAPATAPQGAPA
jgi:tellurite resistance protein